MGAIIISNNETKLFYRFPKNKELYDEIITNLTYLVTNLILISKVKITIFWHELVLR